MTTIEDYSYQLPKKLIAKNPAKPRESSRLLVFDSKNQQVVDDCFLNLKKYLQPGDILILNNSKVFPARLHGHKITGGKVELLLLEEKSSNQWIALVGGKISIGEKIFFGDNFNATVIEKNGKEAKVKFNLSGVSFWRLIDVIGETPIPPYIKDSKLSEDQLRREYQTVYAQNFGSAAAPTAGLHFSKEQIGEIKALGVDTAYIDLKVGLGTFAPLDEKNFQEQKLHLENFSVPSSTIKKINKIKKTGGKVVAVGTTVVRALESAAEEIIKNSQIKSGISASTKIFIQPGFEFKIVDSLITNFHLPSSSLMMLVAAFLQYKGIKDGREELLKIYQQAINKKYRFYSFGDAMMIL